MRLRYNVIIVTLAFILLLAFFASFNGLQSQTAIAGGEPPTAVPTVANYLPMILKPAVPTPTNTPMPMPTNTPPPANVKIVLILYNPDGDDVLGEYVRLENQGGTAAVLTGWTLSDDSNHVYDFPGGFSLAPGASVLVWVKSGVNNASNLYWGSAQAFWNNGGDTAYLRNGITLVDSCSYPGGGVQATC